jgi:phosphate butyryltransferase
MQINDFKSLRDSAGHRGPRRVAVVMADHEVSLAAIHIAHRLGIATPVLIGAPSGIEQKLAVLAGRAFLAQIEIVDETDPLSAARRAVQLAREGAADVILKASIRTDQLLRTVLDPENGLRTGQLLSDVLLYEDTLSGKRRLVAITDGGINVLPTLQQKSQIIRNAVMVMHALGHRRPRIALLSATEAVSEAMPSAVEAHRLSQSAASQDFGACEVFGPLALDNALLASAAHAKGIDSPVAGHADVMLVPNIEAGNLLGKAVKYFAGSQCAHVVVGAAVPVLIPSRVESVDDKVNAIALGILIHG